MKRAADITGCGTNYYIDFEGKGLITMMLPKDIIEKIFLSFRNIDILSASKVSRSWQKLTLSIAKINISEINNFVNLINPNVLPLLPKKSRALSRLESAVDDLLKLNNYPKFPFIQYLMLKNNLKEKFFSLLYDLTADDQQLLRNISITDSRLGFLNNAFDLARIYKEIEELHKIMDEDVKQSKYKTISLDLVKALIDRDEKPSIPQIHEIKIAKILFSKGISETEILRYLQSIMRNINSDARGPLAKEISMILIRHGMYKKVLQYLDDLPIKPSECVDICESCSQLLTSKGLVEEAQLFANFVKKA